MDPQENCPHTRGFLCIRLARSNTRHRRSVEGRLSCQRRSMADKSKTTRYFLHASYFPSRYLLSSVGFAIPSVFSVHLPFQQLHIQVLGLAHHSLEREA